MSLFGLVNTTTNALLGGLLQPPRVTPPVLPPVSESDQPRTADPDQPQNAAAETTNTQPAAGQAAAPKTGDSSWAGQLPPPADRAGAIFDLSPEALEKAAAATPAPNRTDTPLPAEPAAVTGRTMARVESDEDRLRAWALGMLQQERRAALPLSLVTDATATPPAQAGSVALDGSQMAAARADLAATPARVLARA